MRKSLPLLVFVLLLVLGALWFVRERPERGLRGKDSADLTVAEREAALSGSQAQSAEITATAPSSEEERVDLLAAPEAVPPSIELPRSRIFGRVTDVSGEPLLGIPVRLSAPGCRWVSKEEHPEDIPKYETATDPTGHFELNTLLPSCDWISLIVEPSDFYSKTGRNFGYAGGRKEVPLREGDNDQGTFVLVDAGAFEGTVRDEKGRAIKGARVSLTGSFPGGYVLGSTTDEQGRYRVGGVPEGIHGAKAFMRGFVNATRTHLESVTGELTPNIDFVLRPAPKISGRVLNEEGTPLAGVRLWGWPAGGGQGAGGKSTEEGTFTVFLRQVEPYNLEATLEGYEKFDSQQQHYPPGTEDLELVLKKLDLMLFAVIDAESGQSVERFGLRSSRSKAGAESKAYRGRFRTPQVLEHEGGEALLPGTPELQTYALYAPGYAPQRGPVQFDQEGEPRQTIRVQRGGKIRGRLRMNGEPLSSPTLVLDPERVPLRPGITEGKDDIFSDDWGPDVQFWLTDRTLAPGKKDGSFEVDDLSAGTYRLTLTAVGAAPVTVGDIRVELGETTDLGDVLAIAPSEIHGVVVLGQGLVPAGLVIALGSQFFADDDKALTTDASGSFSFTKLGEGTHYLWIEEKAGVLTKGPPVEVELGPGEIKTVQVDLSERLPATLEVHVSIDGRGVEAMQVMVTEDGPRGRRQTIGTTNSEGMLLGYPGATRSAVIEVRNPLRLLVGRSPEPVELAPGVRTRHDLDFSPGRLKLRLPAASGASGKVAPSRESFVYVLVTRIGSPKLRQPVILPEASFEVEGTTRTMNLGWIEPGNYELSTQDGESRPTARVEVRAGETATCDLTK